MTGTYPRRIHIHNLSDKLVLYSCDRLAMGGRQIDWHVKIGG